jgi:hypothetical protein
VLRNGADWGPANWGMRNRSRGPGRARGKTRGRKQHRCPINLKIAAPTAAAWRRGAGATPSRCEMNVGTGIGARYNAARHSPLAPRPPLRTSGRGRESATAARRRNPPPIRCARVGRGRNRSPRERSRTPMPWIHRIIEHRLTPERRKGLENRIADRRRKDTHATSEHDNRRKTERRQPRDRRTRESRRGSAR